MGRRAQGTDITLRGGPSRICRGLVYRGLEKALEMGTFLHRGPVKNHGVRSPGTLIVERGLWRRGISLWAFCEENLDGCFFTGDPEGYVEEDSSPGQVRLRTITGAIFRLHIIRELCFLFF